MGPLQRGLPVGDGAEVMAYAFSKGVNFVDTAELYETYDYIRAAAKLAGKHPVIATKSYAHDRETALKSIEKARAEMDIDVIDIFMVHEQEGRHTLEGHMQAFEALLDAKAKGAIRAVGVSTHYVEVVEAASEIPWLDVVHPLINYAGLGIQDGGAEEMLSAIEAAHKAGKGIYAMKVFGGGNLLNDYIKCLEFVVGRPCFDSIALGMQSKGEVDMNIRVIDTMKNHLAGDEGNAGKSRYSGIEGIGDIMNSKRLHIESWCQGCGQCASRCGQDALWVSASNKAEVVPDKCVLCGYCAAACPDFAIKVC